MRPTSRIRRAFTLVELLVVIGIIALLISILLPVMGAARRSANSTKCLAALKEVGRGLQLYAGEYHGAWPVVRDERFTPQRRWTDMIAKYFNKARTASGAYNSVEDIAAIRLQSVLWGCPEWQRTFDYNAAATGTTADTVYSGYGMQNRCDYYKTLNIADLAHISSSAPGTYVKQVVWGRRGAERGVVGDAVWDILLLYDEPLTTAINCPPYDPIVYAAGNTSMDIRRHAKGTTKKVDALKGRYMNLLFADMHAAPVTPVEARNSIIIKK